MGVSFIYSSADSYMCVEIIGIFINKLIKRLNHSLGIGMHFSNKNGKKYSYYINI